MKQKTGIGFIFCLLAIMSVFSCCRKSDEPTPEPVEGTVRICFEWDTIPSGIQPPEGMTLRFYPENGEGTVYEMKSDTASFSGNLPVGNYRVLIYNRPTPGIWFRGQELFETAEACVKPLTRSVETVGQPDWFTLATLGHYEVTKDGSGTEPLPVHPEPIVRRISFRIKVTDAREVESVSGCLLNVAEAVNLSTGKPVASYVAGTDIPIRSEADLFVGSLLVFNLLDKDEIPGGGADKNLRLQINYADETNEVHELDIYDDLINMGDGDNADVELDVTPSGIRFQVRITEWIAGQGPDVSVGK